MHRILIIALASTGVAASPPPLTKPQRTKIHCVAALALVANDQERGAPGHTSYPWIVERGQRYSDAVRAAIAKESGRSDELIRADIEGAIGVLQLRAINSANPEAETRPIIEKCLAVLDQFEPPPPEPSRVRCAAMVALAQSEVQAREGNSKAAKDLSSIAAILDNKARLELTASGKSGTEADTIIGLEREAIIAEAKVNREQGRGDRLDFEHCFREAAKE